MKCPFCGSSLEANAKYCNDCGTAVDSPEAHRAHNVYKGNPPYVPSQRQFHVSQRKPVNSTPEPSYRQRTNNSQTISNAPYNRNTAKKKNGCAIIIFVIVVLFFLFGIVSSFLEDGGFDDIKDTFSQIVSDEGIEIFNTEPDYYGAFIGDDYYENEDANLSFAVPDGFEATGYDFDEREIVGSYRTEFEFVKDDIFIHTVVTDEHPDSDTCIRQYAVAKIESIYARHSFDEAKCDDAFSTETMEFCNREATTVTLHYSIGDENHVCTFVGFDIGEKVMVISVDSPSEEINKTILNQFDEY